jgi:hypothetical protein
MLFQILEGAVVVLEDLVSLSSSLWREEVKEKKKKREGGFRNARE